MLINFTKVELFKFINKKSLNILLITLSLILGLYLSYVIWNRNFATKDSSAQDISSHSCDANDPPIKLISQDYVGRMAPGSQKNVKMEVANCSGGTWFKSQSFQLGSQNPQDNLTFNVGRVQFPADVPTNSSVKVSFTITAPSQKGSYILQYGLLNSQKWFKPYLPPQLIIVGDSTICNEARALIGSSNDAKSVLQNCINQTESGGILELPVGVYNIKSQLKISKPITILTEGTAHIHGTCLVTDALNCATIKAHKDFQPSNAANEFLAALVLPEVSNVTFRSIVIDGNKSSRTCATARSFNILANGNSFNFFYGASINALCGTGLSATGLGTTIAYGNFSDNGYADKNVSDGISVNGKNPTVMNNIIRNNTDVDLIFWGSENANVHFNKIEHYKNNQESYAGLMLNTWDQSEELSNFVNSEFSYNDINCNSKLCGFGIQIGEGPWRQTATEIYGGVVKNNKINGAIQGINIFRAGRTNNPVTVGGNIITRSGGLTTNCATTTGKINVGNRDVINFTNGQSADTNFNWNASCVLPACRFSANYCYQPVTTCNAFVYSQWGQCKPGNYRERQVTNKSPNSCIGGDSIVTGFCNYIEPTSTPIPTSTTIPTVIPTMPPVACGAIDVDNDKKLTIKDFAEFARFWRASCTDSPPVSGCGGKDTNNDKKIDIIDLSNFAKKWWISTNKECVI